MRYPVFKVLVAAPGTSEPAPWATILAMGKRPRHMRKGEPRSERPEWHRAVLLWALGTLAGEALVRALSPELDALASALRPLLIG